MTSTNSVLLLSLSILLSCISTSAIADTVATYRYSGGNGQFQKTGNVWYEKNQDNQAGKGPWREVAGNPGRIRLVLGQEIVEIDVAAKKIFYTEPNWPGYPAPRPMYDLVGVTDLQSTSSASIQSTSFPSTVDTDRACAVLYQKLDRPQLRSQKTVIGHYTDLLTPPQTKSECTHVYDTGVPDLATCTTTTDACASKWTGPFGTWGCIPGTTTKCTNAKACDTYKHYKKTMECDITFQMKLPNFVEKPLSDFIDSSYQTIESGRASVRNAIPLSCAPANVRQTAAANPGQALADAVGNELQRRIKERVEREAREWLQETAIQTVIASIPSGGVGGGAVMTTKLAEFVYRVHRVVKPIIQVANDAKDFAEDVGFGTACGWSEWHEW
ncbi:MAG: hypothetical protein HOP13_10930 [Alphaproteobacteria bacterium]|nr:hypothetical protein [Alphaproteobacteria bacterium]